ncbi:Lysyl-tRNA synthetase (class II) [Archaeoglobus sulfaticallidus PM70-1]|uniref:Lysine--tRNA ligase n=1 Tax=Archaeoglobus sulfaticallidus PM70-1 TaxID=387631 RepID=N0BI26_9EURY|nr:lysine--tRNA ligase [Archaeoglobus sulfaticallidus]AGK61947.1 Lysyl-tRNA synthetase (class II) [Archaeoglobus sulfaticallidus PM70-1]
MTLPKLVKDYIDKLKGLRELGKDPFKIKKFDRTANADEIVKKFSNLNPGDETDFNVRIAGRLMSKRKHGGVIFADLKDSSGRIQLVFRKDFTNEFKELKLVERGDILGVDGFVIKTRRGEVSVLVKEWTVLSKILRPLPDKWHGLEDIETRYRQRYLDFIMNEESRETFFLINKVIHLIRNYLNDNGFIEVYTPILQPVYGGAFARPFETYHHFLEEKMYLRIAPELYLKRLLVGGFEKVYEFAPCFRNEDVDPLHNPEFIQLEFYWAYIELSQLMDFLEKMFEEVVLKATGKTEIEYQGKIVNFKRPWKKMRMVDAIKEFGGIDVEKMSDDELFNHAKELGIEEERRGEIIEKLFDYYAKDKIVNPTFITHFPVDISPLAKKADGYADRMELYIAGMEVANGFSELNNPIEQYMRFKEEEELRKRSDKKGLETMPMDKDYIRALEYAMPPASGVGIGLGRLFMILGNKRTLREVIAFPTLAKEPDFEVIPEIYPEVLEWYGRTER